MLLCRKSSLQHNVKLLFLINNMFPIKINDKSFNIFLNHTRIFNDFFKLVLFLLHAEPYEKA